MMSMKSFFAADANTALERLLQQRGKSVTSTVSGDCVVQIARPSDSPLQVTEALMTDLPSRPIIYRYGIRKACCGVIRIGKWDRVYDLMDVTTEQPGLCCTTGCLAGMSVPWIIKIDIQTNEADSASQTEKSEIAHFDDNGKRCVA